MSDIFTPIEYPGMIYNWKISSIVDFYESYAKD